MGKFLDEGGTKVVLSKINSYLGDNYLPLSGGTITGDLSVYGNTKLFNKKIYLGISYYGNTLTSSNYVFSSLINGTLSLYNCNSSTSKKYLILSANNGSITKSNGSSTEAFSTNGDFIDTSKFLSSDDFLNNYNIKVDPSYTSGTKIADIYIGNGSENSIELYVPSSTTNESSVSWSGQYTSGSYLGTLNIGDVQNKIYYNDSDYKVDQITETNNNYYPILLSGTTWSSANYNGVTGKSLKIQANPSTGTIIATTFNGDLNGNATSATTASNLSIAPTLTSSTNTSSITLQNSSKYALSVGGQSVIFTTPSSGSTISFTPKITSSTNATQLGTITIDGTSTILYTHPLLSNGATLNFGETTTICTLANRAVNVTMPSETHSALSTSTISEILSNLGIS